MRDVSKPYRLAVFALLNGNVPGWKTYDEKRKVSDTDVQYMLLSTQQQTPGDDNDCAWISQCGIDIEITQRTGSEVSKDDIDDASNAVCQILVPTPWNTPLTSGGLMFQNAFIESIISRNVSISETETIIVKVLRFVCTVTQQI